MPSEEPKKIKKEEIDELQQDQKPAVVGSKKPLSSMGKYKATNNSQAKVSKVKKEEPQSDESPKPNKPSATTNKVKKEENNGLPNSKKISSGKIDKDAKKPKKEEMINRKGETVIEQKQREKKVYELPGQKRDPPDERDPLRIFYETLYKQIPKSEMAQIWMMECGLLSEDNAQIVYEKKQKSKQSLRSPSKTAAAVKSSSKTVTVKKTISPSPAPVKRKSNESAVATKQSNKRKAHAKMSEDDSDDDLSLSAKSKQSNKRKAQDKTSEDDSDGDFVSSTKAKKRRV